MSGDDLSSLANLVSTTCESSENASQIGCYFLYLQLPNVCYANTFPSGNAALNIKRDKGPAMIS